MPTLGAPLDLAKYEARNLRSHQLGTAPSSPVTGQLYYNTADNTLYWWDGSQWVSARGGAAATPPATTGALGTIQLAGDLTGTATSPQIAAGVITDADVNAANKDGAAGTASMRTLGAGNQQAMRGSIPLDQITPPAGDLSMSTKKIIGMADPISAQDGATKNYVDSVAAGLDPKPSVRLMSRGNVNIASAPTSIDATPANAGDRILLVAQTAPAENGIWVYNGSGAAMTRATDMDNWLEVPGAFTFVETGGVQNADTGWVCTADRGGTLGTTAITWTQFSGPGEYVWGNGLSNTGTQIDVGGTANRITVNPDTIDISSSYVGQSSINTVGTITTGVWQGTSIGLSSGGTGAGNAISARSNLGAAGIYNNGATHGAGATITIPQATHLLRATRALIVQVQDNATGNVLLPDISVAANGDVTVTFGASQAANTILVTVMG